MVTDQCSFTTTAMQASCAGTRGSHALCGPVACASLVVLGFVVGWETAPGGLHSGSPAPGGVENPPFILVLPPFLHKKYGDFELMVLHKNSVPK